ncbi:MAG: carboxylesterase [Rhodobacteraceae bacterium]|nr:carboxylesterase [Paracoccaceae bacterium]
MGVIGRVFTAVFGDGRNVLRETVEVFRENAESGAERGKEVQLAAMAAQGAEFRAEGRSRFDLVMDGINRLPRPFMALGCIGLVIVAMVDPVWFSARMAGLALVPEPLWWLLGVIVSFYFGARHQVKGQEFQRSIAETLSRVPQVVDSLNALQGVEESEAEEAGNPALAAWRREDPSQSEAWAGHLR